MATWNVLTLFKLALLAIFTVPILSVSLTGSRTESGTIHIDIVHRRNSVTERNLEQLQSRSQSSSVLSSSSLRRREDAALTDIPLLDPTLSGGKFIDGLCTVPVNIGTP
jgi:hypothetical protein